LSLPKQNVGILAENLASKTECSVFLNVTYNNLWNKQCLIMEKAFNIKKKRKISIINIWKEITFGSGKKSLPSKCKKVFRKKNWTKKYGVEIYYT
jgi:hypothetical protein